MYHCPQTVNPQVYVCNLFGGYTCTDIIPVIFQHKSSVCQMSGFLTQNPPNSIL